ncbi:hypothetical protein DIPPA_01592, partial [Diplonema papillatum]
EGRCGFGRDSEKEGLFLPHTMAHGGFRRPTGAFPHDRGGDNVHVKRKLASDSSAGAKKGRSATNDCDDNYTPMPAVQHKHPIETSTNVDDAALRGSKHCSPAAQAATMRRDKWSLLRSELRKTEEGTGQGRVKEATEADIAHLGDIQMQDNSVRPAADNCKAEQMLLPSLEDDRTKSDEEPKGTAESKKDRKKEKKDKRDKKAKKEKKDKKEKSTADDYSGRDDTEATVRGSEGDNKEQPKADYEESEAESLCMESEDERERATAKATAAVFNDFQTKSDSPPPEGNGLPAHQRNANPVVYSQQLQKAMRNDFVTGFVSLLRRSGYLSGGSADAPKQNRGPLVAEGPTKAVTTESKRPFQKMQRVRRMISSQEQRDDASLILRDTELKWSPASYLGRTWSFCADVDSIYTGVFEADICAPPPQAQAVVLPSTMKGKTFLLKQRLIDRIHKVVTTKDPHFVVTPKGSVAKRLTAISGEFSRGIVAHLPGEQVIFLVPDMLKKANFFAYVCSVSQFCNTRLHPLPISLFVALEGVLVRSVSDTPLFNETDAEFYVEEKSLNSPLHKSVKVYELQGNFNGQRVVSSDNIGSFFSYAEESFSLVIVTSAPLAFAKACLNVLGANLEKIQIVSAIDIAKYSSKHAMAVPADKLLTSYELGIANLRDWCIIVDSETWPEEPNQTWLAPYKGSQCKLWCPAVTKWFPRLQSVLERQTTHPNESPLTTLRSFISAFRDEHDRLSTETERGCLAQSAVVSVQGQSRVGTHPAKIGKGWSRESAINRNVREPWDRRDQRQDRQRNNWSDWKKDLQKAKESW